MADPPVAATATGEQPAAGDRPATGTSHHAGTSHAGTSHAGTSHDAASQHRPVDRLGRRFGYPIVLDLAGVPVLVVGAGTVAARKVEGLLEAGAQVRVVAPAVHDEVRRLTDRLARPIDERAYETGDLDGARLVIVATDRAEVNAAVAADAANAGIWVNAADDPANCTFILPAVARAGRFTVAVSSDGTTPAMSGYVRDRIRRDVLTDDLLDAADEIARQRAGVRSSGGATEAIDWRARIDELLPPR